MTKHFLTVVVDTDLGSTEAVAQILEGAVNGMRCEREGFRCKVEVLREPWDDEDDKPLPEDAAIRAAHPTRTGRHDLYGEAMRLVGAKYSKGALVALVNWLLHRTLPPACQSRGVLQTGTQNEGSNG